MSRTWLILDVSYLAYRSFFTTGGLSYGVSPTGTIFGVLRDSQNLLEQFGTTLPVWCFDRKSSLRKELFPGYKADRHRKMTEDQEAAFLGMKVQVDKMRKEYIAELGYQNIFSQKGYEADDIIASVVQNLPGGDKGIIVSADKDLYQLLSHNVSIYSPQKKELYTRSNFIADYGIRPSAWPTVKAIAGCSSDCIPGCSGVGEKSAAAYISDTLKPGAKKDSIVEWWETKQFVTNLKLVKLPFQGCKNFKPVEDELNPDGWNDLANKLGMRTLIDRPKKSRLAVKRGFF